MGRVGKLPTKVARNHSFTMENGHTQHSHSYGDVKPKLISRLRKIEGQVRGIQSMLEDDRYCVDILIQLSAIKSAINKVGLSLLERHTRGCVTGAIKSGDGDHAIEELMDVINQFTK